MRYIDNEAPLSGLAKLMAMKGRDGDTMLAHINPIEAKMLKAMGGRQTPNPDTGLPEYAFGDPDADGPSGDGGASEGSGYGGGSMDEGDNERATAADFGPGSGFGLSEAEARAAAEGMSRADLDRAQAEQANEAFRSQSVFGAEGPMNLMGNRSLKDYVNAQKMGKLGNFFADNPVMEALTVGLASMVNPALGMAVGLGTSLAQDKGPLGVGLGALSGAGHGLGMLASLGYNLTEDPNDPSSNKLSNIGSNVQDKIEGAVETVSDFANDPFGPVRDIDTDLADTYSGWNQALTEKQQDLASYLGTDYKGALTDEDRARIGSGGGDRDDYRTGLLAAVTPIQKQAEQEAEEQKMRRIWNPAYPTTQQGLLEAAEKGISTPRYISVPAATGGGLQALARGSYGRVRDDGTGDGMSDNVVLPVKGDPMITEAHISPDEYVIDAHTVAALGNGSSEAGAKVLDKAVADIRGSVYNKGKQPQQIDGYGEFMRSIS